MRAWESRGNLFLLAGAWGQRHQRGVGQRPTSEAKPNERDALGFATGLGEYKRVPPSEFAHPRFGSWLVSLAPFAALVGLCPTPHKGAALDPLGSLAP